ncbi:MAG: EAL domain-containing protein [Sphingobium sp.]|nr:EAL domain-containing protein [Sphingobium sp.]MBP8672049.1 EAL domain-containing protein [Sphingobium sp.]MBP9158931.1 EAL domain-containing protein [Sphingobium sp.]MCC6481053.1 EAL domain-containing protein [Sphingomonadaceae bacterium]
MSPPCTDIVETIPSGLVAYHQDGRILFSNSAYERLCGTPCATPDGALWPGEVCYPDPLDAPADSAPHAATDSDTDTEALSRPYIQRLESGRWVQVHDRRSASGNLVSVRTDISELKRTQMQVKRQAEEDPLTGVGNRSKLMRRLTAVTRSRRSSDGVAMLMVIDLDEFKLINDRFGHAGGDTLLQQVARRLRESVRKSDTVARLGGDEFAVLMRAVNGRDAERIAGNLLASICEPLRIGHHAITPSASIGVALFPKDAKTPSELIKNADLALYQAKHKGRRTYSLYEKSVGHRRQRRMRLLEKLKDAIQSRQIDVALQPKCDLSSGRHTGFEALVRWRPGGVAVPPPELISIAEEAGLICELSEIIITRALSAMAGFKHAGLEPGTMAFNIVAAQLQQPDFVERFITLLDVHGLAPCEIEIEVTENVILDRSAGNFASILRKSREAGFSIALDDFGTGYASLVHLKQFPMDFLKIDRSFIAGILTAKDDAIIVRTIISLAHNLGLRVIAEGVETTDQVKLLSNLGCDLVQGFLLARPMSEQQAHKYLKTIHKTGSYLRHQMQDCLKYR